MLTTNAILAGLTCASATYIGLSLALANLKARSRKVGGITFIRMAGYQFSVCRPRHAAVIAQERMAAVTSRAQTARQRRLDAIANQWCNG